MLRLKLRIVGALPARVLPVSSRDPAKHRMLDKLEQGVKALQKAGDLLETAMEDLDQASEEAHDWGDSNAAATLTDATGETVNLHRKLSNFASQLTDVDRYIRQDRLGPHKGFNL